MKERVNQKKKSAGAGLRAGRSRLWFLAVPLCLLLFPLSFAQSGRQPGAEKPPPKSRQQAPPRDTTETRPRRAEEMQDDKPVKLSADLVTVIASVTDAAGNHVSGLTQADFEVYEDNLLQPIAGFYSEGRLPLRLVFLFDTSHSIRHRFDFEQRAAGRFFRQLIQQSDQAALMSVSSEPRLELQLTSDVDRMLSTLAGLKPEGATALYSAMADAARYIRPADGRHVMVVLSDGTDTVSPISLAVAMTEVQKSDIVIYAVHSTGVAPSANVQDLAGEFVLKHMCEDTGGRAFFPPIQDDPRRETRELDEIYRRIAAEVRAQFVLTYYSTSRGRPGSFRTIRVAVKRPGLQVRARRGYYTPN